MKYFLNNIFDTRIIIKYFNLYWQIYYKVFMGDRRGIENFKKIDQSLSNRDHKILRLWNKLLKLLYLLIRTNKISFEQHIQYNY